MKHFLKISFLLTLFIFGCTKKDDGFAPGSFSNPPIVVPFNPTHISQIYSWYDASDATTMSLTGNQVTAWTDKNNHSTPFTQATAGAQPTLQANAINGKSALSFDGNDVMTAMISNSVGADVTVTYVLQLANYSAKIPFSFNTTNYNYGPDIYFNSGVISWNTGDSDANAFSNSAVPTPTTPHIITVKNDSALSEARLYVDGVFVGSALYRNTSIANFTSPRLYIGNWVSGNYYITGYFAELVIYNKVIDETERADLEYYLKDKWGTP